MNEIAKKATADRFLSAIQKEGLTKTKAGANIGLTSSQVSCLFNEKYWAFVSVPGWDKVLAWANSGWSLTEFPKHRDVKVHITEDNRIMLSDIKSNIPVEEQNKAKKEVKIKPENTSNLNFIRLLKEERARLAPQIDAIDKLLELYTS